jgi:hypothetical protein
MNDEKIVRYLRESQPDMFGDIRGKNDIKNLYIYIEGEKIEFKEVGAVDKTISIIVPYDFKAMEEDLIKLKYLSSDRPKYVYTNVKSDFNIAFSVEDNDESIFMEDVRDTMKDYFIKLNPSYEVIDSGNTPINSVPYFIIITKAIDDDICNVFFFLKNKNKMHMGTINKPKYESELWYGIFLQIIDSIVLEEA